MNEKFVDALPMAAWLPFSAGARNCIGQHFAVRETKLMIAHLLHNFEFSTPHAMAANTPAAQVVLKSRLGIPVVVNSR